MKISHCYFSMRIGGVEQNLLRVLPHFLADSEFKHELILTHGQGPLLSKLPEELNVKILEEGNRFLNLSSHLKETDLLHLYTINYSPFYRQAAFLHNIPVIDNIRNMLSCPAPHRVNNISCASNAIGNMQSAPGRVRIIPNGLDLKKTDKPDYKKFNTDAAPTLIEIGRPDKKRVLKAEDIVPALRKKHPGLRCHVVGREGRDQDGIIYHGEVQDPTAYYEESHFLIHFPELEPFGMIVPESYAGTVIPVAGGEGGIKDLIIDGETGFYFPKPEGSIIVSKLDELILQLKQEPEKLKKIAENGFKRLQNKYSLAKHVSSYENLYSEFVNYSTENKLPKIKWSKPFARIYEKISFENTSPTVATALLKKIPDPHERDWLRLWAIENSDKKQLDLRRKMLEGIEKTFFKNNFEFLLLKAETLTAGGNLEEALHAARKAANLCPDIAEPYFLGTELLLRCGKPRQAYNFLRRFQNYAPDYPPSKKMLSQLEELL